MCGIVYKSNFYSNTNEKKFIEAVEALEHRGPDDYGYLFNKEHSFGHKRLTTGSTLAKQPMSILNNHLIYNGVIYNGFGLKQKLNSELEFDSDALLLLKLLIKYGKSVLRELNGIFSFVYTDLDEVLIARDMFGVKPLYYTIVDGDIMVASEIKSLLKYGLEAVVDEDGLCELLGMGPSFSEGKTLYKGIYEVRPGHYLTFSKNKGLKDHIYFNLEAKEFKLSYEDTVKKVRCLVDSAVNRQMIKGVDVSSFLSGGLDSSIISTLLARKVNKLDTYSVMYEDSKFSFNEFETSEDSKYVKLVSEDIKSNQHDVVVSNYDLVKGLKKAVILRDGPGMTDIDSSLLFMADRIAINHKVSFSGECADEVFGGYPWYKVKMKKIKMFPWIRNLEFRESLLNEKYKRKLNLKKYVSNELNRALNSTPILISDNKTTIYDRQMFYLNLKYFMRNLLDRKDRMTMGASLDVRIPFCDKELVEFLYNVPFKYKYHFNVEKKLLRDAYKGVVIKDVLNRKKSPYPKSNSLVYKNLVNELLTKCLEDENSILYELFDCDRIKKLLNDDRDLEVPWYGQLMRKTALLAYLYQIDYWFKEYNIRLEVK